MHTLRSYLRSLIVSVIAALLIDASIHYEEYKETLVALFIQKKTLNTHAAVAMVDLKEVLYQV